MLTDTHVHFDGLMQASDSLDAIVARAAQAGVSRMLAVGGSADANRTALEIARAYPGQVRAAIGYNRDQADVFGRQPARHSPLGEGGTTDARPDKEDARRQTPDARPEQANTEKDGGDRATDELETMLRAPEVAAVGEIGLDFHHGRETAAEQVSLFNRMLALARDHHLPVCVHTREAETETLAALREHAAAWRGAPDRIGVMHCFTGDEKFARELLALGFFISFSGIVTFKNAGGLLAVAALVPDERLLIETDAPYLAPEPFRGQPNEPAHVRRVAEKLAELRHTTWKTIAEITTRNAAQLFGRSESLLPHSNARTVGVPPQADPL